MIVKSERILSLKIPELGVSFIEGVCEVSDPEVIEKLRGFAHFGLVFPEGDAPKRGRPKKP